MGKKMMAFWRWHSNPSLAFARSGVGIEAALCLTAMKNQLRRILSIGAMLALVLVVTRVSPAFAAPQPETNAPDSNAGKTSISSDLSECLDLLRQAAPKEPTLVPAVEKLLSESAKSGISSDESPTVMVVSYRKQRDGVGNVVVQLYHSNRGGGASNLLNTDGGYVQNRLGGDLFGSADSLMGMLYYQATYLGNPAEVERQQRAFQATLGGDLTLLREQTIDPLNVIAVVPRAGQFLPGSLRTRVHGVVVNSRLEFNEWKSNISLISDDNESAQQVGTLMSAWREIGVSLADSYATTATAEPLRAALKASTIEVVGNDVTISAAVPAQTVVRCGKELGGHGGGCPPGAPCPKDKVAICHMPPGHEHNCHTICVSPSAVPAHLAHGDYCGPCQMNKVTICFKGHTIQVPQSAVQCYLNKGATLGPCQNCPHDKNGNPIIESNDSVFPGATPADNPGDQPPPSS